MNSSAPVPAVPTLADLLGPQDRLRVPPLVLLKAGSANPPIFMAHGMGGSVIGVYPLAMCIRVANPIYGMQARGIDGLDDPHERIEDMAEYHLDAIRRVQPHGPYYLIGYSLGGLVTLEIARRLSGTGEQIALLAMLDSYPHRRNLSFGQHARLALRLAKRRALSLVQSGGPRHRSYAGMRTQQNTGQQPPSGELAARAMQRVGEYQDRAWRNYHPQFYDGKINFVRAAIPSFVPNDPVAVWAQLTREFEFETVSGNHHEMLTTKVETLACLLSRYVEEALGSS